MILQGRAAIDGPPTRSTRPTIERWEFGGLAALVLLFLGSVATLALPPEEDAFIYYRYAWNWAHGNGLAFNPEDPVEGFSGPLWMVGLGIVARLGLDLPQAASVLGALCGVGTLLASWTLARWVGLGARGRLGSTAALALSMPFATWARSGLETPLYALLLTLACGLYLRPQVDPVPHARFRWLTGLSLLAVVLCRPEAVLLLLLVFVDRSRCERWNAAIPYVLPGVLGYGALLVFRYAIFGSLAPNTSVKLYTPLIGRSTAQALAYVFHLGVLPVLLPLVALAQAPMRARARVGFLFAASLLLSFGFNFLAGGDYRPGFRYFIPTLPLLLVGCWHALESLRAAPPGNGLVARVIAHPGAPVALLGITLLGPAWDQYAHPLQLSGWRERVLDTWLDPYADRSLWRVETALWIDAAVPPGSVVAFGQMGMVPYYLSRRGHAVRFIDTLGLVDREVASHYRIGAKLLDLGRRIASGASARDALAEGRRERARRVAESILARQPDYILLETELESNGMLEELAGNPRFRGDYTLVAALPVAAAPRVRIFARAAAALRAGISPAS